MAKFSSKPQLITSIIENHGLLLRRLESIPRDRYREAGVWGDDWNIVDLLSHLSAWEQMLLDWHRSSLSGAPVSMPAAGYKWNETPRLNRAIQKEFADRGTEDTLAVFKESYEEILAFVNKLSPKDLLEPGRLPWTGKHAAVSYIAPNTTSHYSVAIKFLKRWERIQKP